MLDCEQALDLISAKLDGALTAEESAALEEHLAACPGMPALLADFEELHLELPKLAAQPPADLKDNIMAEVRRSKVTPFQGKKKQWRWRSLASLRRCWCWYLWAAAPCVSGRRSLPGRAGTGGRCRCCHGPKYRYARPGSCDARRSASGQRRGG